LADRTSTGKRTVSEMLDQYLVNPPTITEKLAFSQSPRKAAETVGNERNDAKYFLYEWQASWDMRQ
jgi:hypothetical protein